MVKRYKACAAAVLSKDTVKLVKEDGTITQQLERLLAFLFIFVQVLNLVLHLSLVCCTFPFDIHNMLLHLSLLHYLYNKLEKDNIIQNR